MIYINMFRIQILQVVKSPIDWTKINSLSDSASRESALGEARKEKNALINQFEPFWIGYFKTQFGEFGKNTHEGGELGAQEFVEQMDYA